MFDPSDAPRVFGLAPGVDFPRGLIDGLLARFDGQPPEALARVQLIVNTTRMARRVQTLFDTGPARLLPKVHLVTHLDQIEPSVALPPAVSPLRRRLELIELVAGLIERQVDLAPQTSLYALTDSLAALMDEMQGEGVTAEDIRALDVSDQSAHWQRAQAFIGIAHDFLQETTTKPDKETRQRHMVRALSTRWRENPPQHPVILAGSTGSRGTTLLLMEAIAQLPQGALILPGYDFDMPPAEWSQLNDPLTSQDHPQYRFHKLLQTLRLEHSSVRAWHTTTAPAPERNALVSLSLRPAPVTHAWLSEGPQLKDLACATKNITLLEAPSPRLEALTIAMRLRKAVEDGQHAAVITPDRMLTRQITAALDQWNILPDDSAGAPLHLSPPGRYLRHIASLFHRRLDAEALLTLLKHPLTQSTKGRGAHVLNTQRLELLIRRNGLPYPTGADIETVMARARLPDDQSEAALAWAAWVGRMFDSRTVSGKLPLGEWVSRHIALAEALASGQEATGSGVLWDKKAGREALSVMEKLQQEAAFGGPMLAHDYANLVGALLADGEVRDRDAPHPGVMIWGTLEARVQGADLVILAGLNDGTWPEAPDPDPWLNRSLRNQARLLLPERRIGLSAHDYQQAIAAPEVWITRSIRSDDAETVPSRWLNRLSNLLEGLKDNQGPELMTAMRQRGAKWITRAQRFEAVEEATPAARPAPRPPVTARPSRLAVTDIKHLIRDPYAIYAKHILRLRKLGPLVQSADALTRGTVSHEVMEHFVRQSVHSPERLTPDVLMEITREVLDAQVPWPAARALWTARLKRISDWFVAREKSRQHAATPRAFEDEAKGKLIWPDLDFTLVGRADRVDQNASGDVLLYDYKTGAVPTAREQMFFDKQLLIEAAMIEEGAFEKIGTHPVARAVFIGLGTKNEEVDAPLAEEPPAKVLTELRALIIAYQEADQGYTARRALKKDSHPSDYDLLSRFGEWDETQDPVPEDLT
ncbi:MAG: double-strand break repair protein AddB [Roseobacter sp.]